MNILFISNLTGNLFAGPNYSVPAQVLAQSAYDRVFWYNLNRVKRPEWMENGLDCKNLEDYPSGRLADLPKPFDKPDAAVVEELYCYPFCKLIKDLQKAKIPYVIVPRSTMTAQAQQKKALKKKIGNLLWFNAMVKKAAAVQYLTKEEQLESGRWKVNNFVIPNGIYPQTEQKTAFSATGIKAVYIGRFEIYQKGLDLLLAAMAKEQKLLRESGFTLAMYGPNQEGTIEALQNQAKELQIEDLLSFHGSVFKDEKKSVLLSSDVFVMTSRFEGLPMGMIEALAYGLPTLATTGTNLAEEIRDAEAGWTSDNSVDGIAQMLRAAVADKDRYPERSQNALGLSAQYNWQAIAEKTHVELVNIIDRGK